jgi:hypothetical protein
MKKFVYSAIALSMATGVSYANNGWTTLDQEISGLSSSLTAQNAGGPKVGGWVITSVRSQGDAFSEEVDVDIDGDGIPDDTETKFDDELGFNLDQVRLHVTGDVSNDYSYKVSFELESGSAELKDAYIKWKLMDSISATMGQFYLPTFRSATSDETKLLFLERTVNGGLLNLRDQGIMVGGNFEMVNFGVAVQDGEDENADELRITLNVTADVMGKGAGAVEGAYGAAEGTNLSVGGFYHMDDGAGTDGNDVFGVEAYFTMGAIAVSGEFGDYDLVDGSAYSLTASYLFTEMYEVAVRFENLQIDGVDFDDPSDGFNDAVDADFLRVAVNRYSAGHNLKWTLQYSMIDSTVTDGDDGDDTDTSPDDEIALGLTLAF